MGVGLSIGALALSAALAACSHPGVSFTTTLGAPNGLASGNPVTHAGARIGQVTGVRPSLYGSPTVDFYVDETDAPLVHQDSIMVLETGGAEPSLSLDNPNPMSPPAAAGSQITGASSEAEASAIRMSRGMGSYAMGLAQFLGSVNSGPNPPANSAAVAAATAQLFAIQQMAAANAYANSAAARQQVDQLNRQLQAIAQQMQQAGQTAQAQQLRNQIEQLLRATAPPPGAPNTLVTPRVYP